MDACSEWSGIAQRWYAASNHDVTLTCQVTQGWATWQEAAGG